MRVNVLAGWVVVLAAVAAVRAAEPGGVCGVYSSILEFDSRRTLEAAVRSEPSFLMGKHKRMLAGMGDGVAGRGEKLRGAEVNAAFLTLYPIHGKDWWAVPAAREMVRDGVVNAHAAGMRVHLGVSLFNGNFCDDPGRYKGASRTIQCDGTGRAGCAFTMTRCGIITSGRLSSWRRWGRRIRGR